MLAQSASASTNSLASARATPLQRRTSPQVRGVLVAQRCCSVCSAGSTALFYPILFQSVAPSPPLSHPFQFAGNLWQRLARSPCYCITEVREITRSDPIFERSRLVPRSFHTQIRLAPDRWKKLSSGSTASDLISGCVVAGDPRNTKAYITAATTRSPQRIEEPARAER